MKPRASVRPVNPARKAREFARAYGSQARVEWIKAYGCLVCPRVGSQNAHLPSKSGAGRKGDAKYCVPLCHQCHNDLDHKRLPASTVAYLYKMAAVLDAQWRTLTETPTR